MLGSRLQIPKLQKPLLIDHIAKTNKINIILENQYASLKNSEKLKTLNT